jgi:hypothetical protein
MSCRCRQEPDAAAAGGRLTPSPIVPGRRRGNPSQRYATRRTKLALVRQIVSELLLTPDPAAAAARGCGRSLVGPAESARGAAEPDAATAAASGHGRSLVHDTLPLELVGAGHWLRDARRHVETHSS